MIDRLFISFAICGFLSPILAWANDFPTQARAEYVLACMSSAGEDARNLRQCSCAIDHIASDLPYDKYVAAETVMRMRKLNGEKGSLFRESDSLHDTVKILKSAEAGAEKACF